MRGINGFESGHLFFESSAPPESVLMAIMYAASSAASKPMVAAKKGPVQLPEAITGTRPG